MVFSTTRRVEFRDTDAAGIVHFSAFFPMMESAEHEMLRSLGISVLPKESEDSAFPPVTWPRVAAGCRYVSAARFEDLLSISVRVAKIGNSSVQYEVGFTRDDCLIAEGSMTAVCCKLIHDSSSGGAEPGVRLEKVPIPQSIRNLLNRHQ